MKPWMKWGAAALILAVLAAGTLRTLASRRSAQADLQAQQATQKAQVTVELAVGDLVQIKSVALTQTIAISGPIVAVNTAWVKARVPGELRDLNVREGDTVKLGQILARVDPTESDARVRQARQQAASAKAQLDIAQRGFDNNRALVAQGFISGTALETSQANLSAAQANLAAALSGTDLALKALDDTVLHAPIAGQISQRLVQSGERVAVEARVVEIVDNHQLELQASLNAADALLIKLGQTALVTLEGTSRTLAAKVTRINPAATAGNRAVLAYLSLAPSSFLRHGLFTQGALQVGSLTTAALPLSAVRTDQPQPYVQWVSNGQVQHANVSLGVRGESDGVTLVAISGLPEGSVVIDGSVGRLRAGTPVKMAATATEGK
jgi:RND family efflux transporter MFP subunit